MFGISIDFDLTAFGIALNLSTLEVAWGTQQLEPACVCVNVVAALTFAVFQNQH